MKTKVLLVLVLLAMAMPFAGVVEAQTTVIQYYLLPVDVQQEMYRGPMYLMWRWNPDGLDVPWGCKDYGLIDIMICAVDADATDHAWLASQTDVYQFPVDLDANPSPAELSTLEAAMESAYIAADWLNPAETWRQALRTVTGMFLFMQRLTAITGNTPLDWGVTLNTQFRNLDQVYQDAITQAFNDLDYDASVIRTNWTLRILLKNAADQWGEKPIYFGISIL